MNKELGFQVLEVLYINIKMINKSNDMIDYPKYFLNVKKSNFVK